MRKQTPEKERQSLVQAHGWGIVSPDSGRRSMVYPHPHVFTEGAHHKFKERNTGGKQPSEAQAIHSDYYLELQPLSRGLDGHSYSLGPNGKRSFRESLRFYTYPFLYSKFR